jgi:uncharacterized protein (DUF1697 family)
MLAANPTEDFMNNLKLLVASGCVVVLTACGTTHVNVMQIHREDMSAQARVLAVAARNFEDSVHRNRAQSSEEEAARAVVDFHTETEEFARATARWISDENVNTRYEALIRTWVKVKQTFPNLHADALTQDAYRHATDEWEKMERVSGYAGRKYEKKVEEGK